MLTKAVMEMMSKFKVTETVARRLYTLFDWEYGTEWDKARLRSGEALLDKPKNITIEKIFTSPSQELSYLMRKYNIEFKLLAQII